MGKSLDEFVLEAKDMEEIDDVVLEIKSELAAIIVNTENMEKNVLQIINIEGVGDDDLDELKEILCSIDYYMYAIKKNSSESNKVIFMS